MFKYRFTVFAFLLGSMLFALPASAQDSKEPVTVNFDGATGSIGIQRELQTTAKVELVVGDQIYHLNVPVTVQIDASAVLTDANLAAPVAQQVGVVLVEPVEIERVEGDYEKEYRTVSPGAGNVVVVYRANLTNLDSAVLEAGYTSNLSVMAIDDAGNVYEVEQSLCDSINPGEKVSCEFIFNVPTAANLVDLEVKTVAYKRFSFAELSTSR